MGVLQVCVVCGASEASVSCSECEQTYYCSTNHQEAHWSEHIVQCQPTVIERENPQLGRYLVAARDFAAGELLFKEIPIALGPRASSRPMCLGCHKSISDPYFVKCPKCCWPLCSIVCASSKLHEAECQILAKDTDMLGQPENLGKSPCYDIILVLRCLLLQNSNQKAWNRLLLMASHDFRMANEQEVYHMATIRYINEILEANFDPKFIHHARGAIMANCFEYPSLEDSEVSLRGVYPKTGRFNHSCLPNVALSIDCNGVMHARAAIDLKALSTLLITYTGTLVPLWERQAYLQKIHYFTCDCSRCHDPTELGLHYSSPKCDTCQSNLMEPKTWCGETIWECPECNVEHKDAFIRSQYSEWISKFNDIDTFITTSPRGVRKILEGVESTFHPTHHIWEMAAQVAIRTLQPDESRDSLMLRYDLWKKLLRIYDILEPGTTSRRGVTIYELGLCLASLTRVEMKEGRLIDHFYKLNLKEALQHIQTAVDILSVEPPKSHETPWYEKAVQAVENMKQDLVDSEVNSNICSLNLLKNADSKEKLKEETLGK